MRTTIKRRVITDVLNSTTQSKILWNFSRANYRLLYGGPWHAAAGGGGG
jgi:hypothetical protein